MGVYGLEFSKLLSPIVILNTSPSFSMCILEFIVYSQAKKHQGGNFKKTLAVAGACAAY